MKGIGILTSIPKIPKLPGPKPLADVNNQQKMHLAVPNLCPSSPSGEVSCNGTAMERKTCECLTVKALVKTADFQGFSSECNSN